jgi:voltage-gated potassium channel
LASVIILGYALSVITEYILSKNNLEELTQKKMQKKIDSLKNHIIICGYGRNGKQAAKKLLAYKKPFVVIEKNKELIDKFQNDSIPFVFGNANEDETLLQAGVDRASTLILAMPNDADNLFVVLSARQMNNKMKIISRASQETSYNKLKMAGANNVILPDKIGGDHMASLVVVPDLMEFVDNLSIVGKFNINIEEIAVEKLYNTSEVKTITDLDLRRKTGCTVIGFKDGHGEYILNPESEVRLVPNSKIIVLGRPEQIEKLNSIYNIK